MDKPIITADGGQAIWTFDQLLRQRAVDQDQTPLLAYPRSRHSVADYEPISGRDLDRFVDGAAAVLVGQGLHPVVDGRQGVDTGGGGTATAEQGPKQGHGNPRVVGVLGRTDLDYIVSVFALGRLGFTPFLISPRLAPSAVETLLDRTAAVALLYSRDQPRPQPANVPIILQTPIREEYDTAVNGTTGSAARPVADPRAEQTRLYIMLHSSGSTGLPKPIDYTNRRLLSGCLVAQHAVCFQSVPMSHAHGLMTILHAIYTRGTLYLMNGHVPQTHDTVTAAIVAASPEVVYTVPYVLKLLTERPDGIAALRRARLVAASGSRTPDELGDLLIREGVHFGVVFGSTETAMILNSVNRPREDKAWNYLRPPPHVVPYLWMRPVDGEPGVHEAIILDGHKGKTMSNSDDPPNSWHTNDLFLAHPTIPNAWKFVGRKDDRITLLNGEKVLPLPIEGRIRQHALIKEAVVFGVDREVPGLLLFRASTADGLSDEGFLDRVWPTVQEANKHAEAFSQISRDMIAVLPDTVDCPSTDKSSVKRGQVYRDFAEVIEATYSRLEDAQQTNADLLDLDEAGLQAWITDAFETLGVHLVDPDVDFFSAGVDSLKAIHLRSLILKSVNLGGNTSRCSPMIVYDCGTVRALARRLISIRGGEAHQSPRDTEVEIMETWIRNYSTLSTRHLTNQTPAPPPTPVVMLTGVTGFLGGHVLAKLLSSIPAAKVYCLLRQSAKPAPQLTALERLSASLAERALSCQLTTTVPLYADTQTATFGLDESTLETLRSEVTHIIHCAWPVNFALPLQAFEPAIRSLHNLLEFANSASHKAHILFCSSVATALGAGPFPGEPVVIPSAPVPSLSYATPTGYGRSKLVAEQILSRAAAEHGIQATVFRIGQIIPGRAGGSKLWNPTEAVPLIIRSALTTGALPLRETGLHDECRWAEADELSATMLELGGILGSAPVSGEASARSNETHTCKVYNLVNPRPFSWNCDLLPALRKEGLQFDAVPWPEWLRRLEDSVDDPELNPARKLIGYFREQQRGGVGNVRFDTRDAEASSESMRQWGTAVGGELVRELVAAWKRVWIPN